ncbi:carbohydrate kinase family protein [Halorubrum cibi]|uniref:Ribokinase/sulfofructose kinase n=1 Tax=Halorubrum cibi TaxID=413815 RepID=A0A521B895_9EURY|nr:carbohydrate kinase family protein [Halorubrum cibi]SMO43306.1 ribokinase/sulfofructose kinase [Halorubrum cibi]
MTGGTEDDHDPPRVTAIGAAAVDEWYAVSNLPEPDGGAYASEVETAPGGVGANVAVGLDRLGRDVGLVSRVGDDEYGDLARSWLAESGVDGSRVAVGDEPTTRSVILSAPDGERAIVTAGESFRELRLDPPTLESIVASEVVFITAYAPDRVARAVLDRVLDVPESDRPALVFDLSGPVEELAGRGTEPETVYGYLHRADLFVAGGVAAPAYFGGREAAIDRLRAVRTPSVGPAVLTHGADGMTVVAEGESTRIDGFDVDVVDTTGAGDAFLAGLIDRWLLTDRESAGGRDRTDLLDAVRFAAAVAAINCTERFTQTGLPTREALEAFLATRDVDLR